MDEARGETFFQNRVHLLGGSRINGREIAGELFGRIEISKGSKDEEPKSVGDVKNASENSARTSSNWVMAAGV